MVITPAQWQRQPWKNGRGTTAEVLRLPSPATANGYDLRISVADVTESGPFSTFPGYTRWTLLLEGGPISLARDGKPHELVEEVLVEIEGDEEVVAHVTRPARLLNILTRSPIEIGIGESSRGDIVFALDDTRDLKKWHTRVFASPSSVDRKSVWIRRS